MAFIVNVGLFVKAKINLQNAVDAAAWSGAAVQARQLTNIAYLNWEMRNTYKEWMFKYYVLGNIATKKLHPSRVRQMGDTVNFRLDLFWTDPAQQQKWGDSGKPPPYDPYNLPSICIHFSDTSNICSTFDLPGIPRFEVVGVPGLSDKNEAFLNTIEESKAEDCSKRSIINFGMAMLWTYGDMSKPITASTPKLATDRVGAWTLAFEQALRMRNLEMIVNRPPVSEPICYGGGCRDRNVTALQSMHGNLPLDERPIKAFTSAYRNLDDTMRKTFRLTEIKPIPFSTHSGTLSGFLIPNNASIGNTSTQATQKHYLDLQMYPLNLAIFFSMMVTQQEESDLVDHGLGAACTISKTAIPVPGYIFGFVKNPKVLTYYAVEGEAKFTGLFYPFASDGITLRAYAAAKPYGGRIGPRIFAIEQNAIKPRARWGNSGSGAYLSALVLDRTADFIKGYPIPLTKKFWVQGPGDTVGGVPTRASPDVKFAIPNLLFSFDQEGELSSQNKAIQFLRDPGNSATSRSPTEEAGLYRSEEYFKFAGSLAQINGTSFSQVQIAKALNYARRPTKYEALNYLIPSINNDALGLSSVATVNKETKYARDDSNRYMLYAPLIGIETLYDNADAVVEILDTFATSNEGAIATYVAALKAVSLNIKSITTGQSNRGADLSAAYKLIWAGQDLSAPGYCDSIAGKLEAFYTSRRAQVCGLIPLRESIKDYLYRDTSSKYQNYYLGPDKAGRAVGIPYKPLGIFPYGQGRGTLEDTLQLTSGYMPGRRQGASNDKGWVEPPYSGASGIDTPAMLDKRNFYSTKLVSLEKLISGGQSPYSERGLFMESAQLGITGSDVKTIRNQNTIRRDELRDFGSPLDH